MIKNRLNKIEDNLFSDKQIEDICKARLLFRRLTRLPDSASNRSEDDAIEGVIEYFPNVPVSLITGKIRGKLALAEKALLQKTPLIPKTVAAPDLFNRSVNERGMDIESALNLTKETYPDVMQVYANAAKELALKLDCQVDQILDIMMTSHHFPAEFLPEIKKFL